MAAVDTCGIRLAMLDAGGGFPVRYDTDPPPARYAVAISEAAAGLPYPVALACEPALAIKITNSSAACSPLDEKAEFTITAASDGIRDSA
jgi:diaminopimelate decarboxylase